jgi:hypothetical protein
MPKDSELSRTVLNLSNLWGMDRLTRSLEAHGVINLDFKSCARCLAQVYEKGSDDWEDRGREELSVVLSNFQRVENRDLLRLQEPVLCKILGAASEFHRSNVAR